jgi:hypothetical protein
MTPWERITSVIVFPREERLGYLNKQGKGGNYGRVLQIIQ